MSRKRNLLIKHVMQRTQTRQSAGRHQRVEIVQKFPAPETIGRFAVERDMNAKYYPRRKK